MQAAAALFSERGFSGATTREIAAHAGTSETVLFRHFESKEALYAAILEQQVPAAGVERWLAELRAFADRRDDEALFGAVVTAILDSFRRDRVYHRLMLFAALEGHELARVGEATYSAPILGFLRDYVERRQAEGAFRRMRPEWVVHMLVGPAAHFAHWKALGANPLRLTEREVTRQAVALLAALRATP